MKRLQVTGGSEAQSVSLFGDPQRQQEPTEFQVYFPGGSLSLTRVQGDDGRVEYWAHVAVFHADHPDTHRLHNIDRYGDPKPTGRIIDARVDRWDKGARETIELAEILNSPNVDHIAVRVRPEPPKGR